MTPTAPLTDVQRVTLLKHLANGKGLDIVATIMHATREVVLAVASNHGYPDREKLAWAADVLEKKIADQERTLPGPRPTPPGTRPTPVVETARPPAPVTKPDEIRALLDTAKAHPSKRIQAAGERLDDQVDKLRQLLADDQRKHAEKRSRAAAKERQRAEVKRLEAELKAARSKLRVTTAPKAPASTQEGPSAATVRAWAASAGVDCPGVGRVPAAVREKYDAAHAETDG